MQKNLQQNPKLKRAGSVYIPISQLVQETGMSEKEAGESVAELNQAGLLDVGIYDLESKFIGSKSGYDCFTHIRVDKGKHKKLTKPSRIHQYWDTFYENVLRYVMDEVTSCR